MTMREEHLAGRCGLRSSAPTRSATASSSTATTPRRSAASMAAPRWRLVSDHAVHLAGRSVREALPEIPRRSGDRQEQIRHRPGGRRDRRHRHGDRRGLERRARLHRHLRPGHLADAGIPRPGLFRGNPRRDLRRAARRPVHRHADAHPAGRSSCSAPMPAMATPSMCCCSRKTRASASSSAAQAFDLAERLQTPIFVMLDLDIGMNDWLCEPLRLGRQPQLRPRQGDDRGRAGGRQGFRPLSRCRRRRHPLPHPTRHASDARAPISPAAPSHDRYARKYSEEGAVYSTTCSACCASSRPRRRWCRRRCAATPSRRRATA